jgi:hypothetical protein
VTGISMNRAKKIRKSIQVDLVIQLSLENIAMQGHVVVLGCICRAIDGI